MHVCDDPLCRELLPKLGECDLCEHNQLYKMARTRDVDKCKWSASRSC